MDNNFVQRHYFDGAIQEELNEAGGKTVILGSPDVHTKNYPGLALTSAEGFFDLIANNCDLQTLEPIHGNRETVISLAAFTCELYLKSILMKEQGLSPKELKEKYGHDLKTLSSALSAESKHSLVKSIDGITTEIDLESKIGTVKKVFMDYRYDYELPSGTELPYAFLIELLMRLRDLAHRLIKEDHRAFYVYGTRIDE